jgi:hypothetical protein
LGDKFSLPCAPNNICYHLFLLIMIVSTSSVLLYHLFQACWLAVNYKSHPKALCKAPDLVLTSSFKFGQYLFHVLVRNVSEIDGPRVTESDWLWSEKCQLLFAHQRETFSSLLNYLGFRPRQLADSDKRITPEVRGPFSLGCYARQIRNAKLVSLGSNSTYCQQCAKPSWKTDRPPIETFVFFTVCVRGQVAFQSRWPMVIALHFYGNRSRGSTVTYTCLPQWIACIRFPVAADKWTVNSAFIIL